MALFDLGPGGEQLLTQAQHYLTQRPEPWRAWVGVPAWLRSQGVYRGMEQGAVSVLIPDGDAECLRGRVALGVSQAAVATRMPEVP